MQFNRMQQGLISASACWDQAMLDTFSPETLAEIKAELTPEEAAQLGESFEEFFTFYQDDSWIFSDTPGNRCIIPNFIIPNGRFSYVHYSYIAIFLRFKIPKVQNS